MRYFVVFLAALFLQASCFAADLTDKDIQQWVASYKAIIEWSKTQDKKDLEFMKQEKNRPDMGHMFSSSLKMMKGHKIYNGFTDVLAKNGYKDPMVWGRLGDRIMSASMAEQLAERKTTSAEAKVKMQKAMAAIEANPNLPPEQKEKLKQMMAMTTQMLNVADKVPQADKDAIKRNEPLIKSVMEYYKQAKAK